MIIAVDKHTKEAVKSGNDYVYLFDKENVSELLKTGLHCVRYDLFEYADVNLTDFEIDCFKKAKITEEFDKMPPHKDYKIAIIIPNYNYSEWLEKCLNSILNQTYKNYEIIFVDDMSTDNSVQIARRLLKKPHKVIELKQKRLNGGARNEAYLHMSDDVDYVWYVDSDDWLKDDTVLATINQRLQLQPDVLFVGTGIYRNDKETEIYIPTYKDRYEAMQGWSGSCGKVIKKELATRQECLYDEGTLKEDRNQHYKICINMGTFANLRQTVYIWNRQNSNSVTTKRNKADWGTSTIRHYADTLKLYLTYQGKDPMTDTILKGRVDQTRYEVLQGGDRQL